MSNGVGHLHVLSLVEPFFPENQSIERLWSPLWRIYQMKWDQHGNSAVSLLWNLYWHEKQRGKLAWELFPLIDYRKDSANKTAVGFLKGLVSYRSSENGKQLNLFYLPWGFHWNEPLPAQM
jgi:hypothetical protein